MSIKNLFKSACCFFLSIVFLSTNTFASVVQSGNLISTMEMVEGLDKAEMQRGAFANIDNKQEVRNILLDYGLTENEVNQRLASLSNVELNQLHDNLQKARAGGVLGTILVVLLIIYLAQRI